uniref:Hydrolase, TatD family n=1 Tax=uncultured Chloroflexota bacterium TaxID=166587 RepID=H5SF35_9CHLR|nr:hydrolase, TatD family [uncultured Chloroflexota bacterium]BAL54771.1 hydrolase, TatD family [uncultured Chloroflexota bacterium]
MKLTDTHCHLDLERFAADRDQVLLRAQAAGLIRILIPALHETSGEAALQLARSSPMLYAAVGVHPTEARRWTAETLQTLRKQAQAEKVVAIGEIGLDYYWDAAPPKLQREVLRQQLELAAQLELPVILHLREKGDAPEGPCSEDLLRMVTEWVEALRTSAHPLAARPGVFHAFSGTLEIAQAVLDLGFYLGVGGAVTYRAERVDMVAALPLDRLLLETDAPFLAPQPHRGKRNEPAYIRYIADKIAEIHSCSQEEVAAITTRNAAHLFSWGGLD